MPIRMPDGSSSSDCILSYLSPAGGLFSSQIFSKFCLDVWTCIQNIVRFKSKKWNYWGSLKVAPNSKLHPVSRLCRSFFIFFKHSCWLYFKFCFFLTWVLPILSLRSIICGFLCQRRVFSLLSLQPYSSCMLLSCPILTTATLYWLGFPQLAWRSCSVSKTQQLVSSWV